MQRLDELIQVNDTGTPGELAQRIGILERSIYEYLKLMKSLGAPISYSRQLQSYYYEIEGMFAILFVLD